MKRKHFWAVAATVVASAAFGVMAYAGPTGAAKADKAADSVKSITGEVVDLWCYLDHKGHGEKHKECAIACAEAGNPMGIVEKSGQIYILMGGKKHQPGRDLMLKKMAQTVTVTGKVIKMGGLQAIYVKSTK